MSIKYFQKMGSTAAGSLETVYQLLYKYIQQKDIKKTRGGLKRYIEGFASQ